jgi:hypothetical protein
MLLNLSAKLKVPSITKPFHDAYHLSKGLHMLTFKSCRSFAPSAFLAVIGLALGTGCVAKPDVPLQQLTFKGEYGQAREHAAKNIFVPKKGTSELSDRQYILSRMRFALSAMSDGYCSEDPVFTEVYERLSQQGINDKNRGAARLINEDVQQWKGEPFEQAIMLSYLSMYYASQGSWDNARAAATSSQFRLKDFGSTKEGKHKTNEDIVREAAEADKAKGKKTDEYFNNYQVRETDFALGILLDAIANQQIGRADEANSKFAAIAKLRPDLTELTEELAKGGYSDLLVVSWGQGPQKIGTGPDKAIAAWLEMSPSDGGPLLVTVAGLPAKTYPLVTDVNQMSQDHAWNSLQDLRKAKSIVGSVMVGAGAGMLAYGAQQRDTGTMVAGAAVALIGAGLKAGAHADTRYCDVMPQRFYIVPIKRSKPSNIDLEVQSQPTSHMTLTGLIPPAKGQPASLRYVNLVSRAPSAPEWAASGEILYNNDVRPTIVSKPFPYILGGDCVRKPSEASLKYYQKSGYLTGMTVSDLEALYREEGIVWDGDGAIRSRHILEGGKSLEAPMAGTAGFARLFGQPHPAYVPRTGAVKAAAAEIKWKTIEGPVTLADEPGK